MDAIAAAHVITRAGMVYSPGWVGFEGGRIREVAEGAPPAELETHRGGPHSVLMPGLVNAHAHLALGGLRHVADDLPFVDWILKGLVPAIGAGMRQDGFFEAGALASVNELLSGGVTTVADSFFRSEGVAAMRQVGLKGVFFREVFGSAAPDDATYLENVGKDLDALDESLGDFPYGYSPHSPWTCPPAVFEAIAKRARMEGRRLSFHLAESGAEHAFLTRGEGLLAEMARERKQLHRYDIGATPTAVLSDRCILGPDCIAAHCIQVTEDDIGLLASAGVSVAHCPVSNMKLGEGIAPIMDMLDAGIEVALGTDSAASTGALDMFSEMRAFLLAQRAVHRDVGGSTASRAIDMATRGGAVALGLGEDTGTLEPGKAADCALIEADRARHGPWHDPESVVAWTATPDDVALVTIDGRVRYRRESHS